MSIAISGSSITFPDQTQMSTAVGGSFRNRIINGDMRIDQRNAGSVVTVATGSPSYTLDRWVAYQNSPSTGVQVSRSTSVPSGFQNSIKWGRNGSGTAGGITVLAQALETANCIDAQGGTVTLSFYAKAGANFSGASSQLNAAVISGTGTDQSIASMVTFAWTGSTTEINAAAVLTTSWQRFTFTSTTLGASVSQLGIYLNWTTVGAAGADDNVYITGVQLEQGLTATEFERRPIGVELALCQRYFWKTVQPINLDGYNVGGPKAYQYVCNPTTMRDTPVVSSTFSGLSQATGATVNVGIHGFQATLNPTAGGRFYGVYSAGNTANAEL